MTDDKRVVTGEGHSSLLELVKDAFRGFVWVFLLLALVKGASYWLAAFWLWPEDPLSVLVMYRRGDIQYYPLITSLADLQVGESVLFEQIGTGVRSFPFASIMPHALAFRLFGAAGFVVTDILVTAGAYLLLFLLFRLINARPWLAGACALLAITGVLELNVTTSEWGSLLRVHIWGWRLPRPFVSELFVMAALISTVAIVSITTARKRYWALLALSIAALVQSEIHSAMVMSIAAAALAVAAVAYSREERSKVIRGVVCFAVAGVICVIPFLLQRTFEHSDVPLRFGAFATPRWPPLFAPRHLFQLTIAVLLPLLLWWLKGRRNSFLLIAALVSAASAVILPVSVVLLGRCAYPNYYLNCQQLITSYSLILCFVFILEWIAVRTLTSPRHTRYASLLLVLLIAGFSLKRIHKTAYRGAKKDDHMRGSSYYPEWNSYRHYRLNFTALTRELGDSRYADAKVLATFDHQVMAWFLAFRRGYSYNPDSFLTTAPDAEIEKRLTSLCRLLGMTRGRFTVFIRLRYVINFWLGANRYQASGWHQFAPLDDYLPADRKMIEESSIYDDWNLAIPVSEVKRLAGAFDSAGEPDERLDLIILAKEPSTESLAPPAEKFELVYENDIFRVWVKK